eukprot:5601173-Pyramimonas_sp.AAC.1
MIGRLWSLIREPLVRQWGSDTEAPWGAAVRGDPSLREAFVGALQQEVPHHLGIAVGEGLVDISRFTIPLSGQGWRCVPSTCPSHRGSSTSSCC